MQRGYLERLGTIVDQLTIIMRRLDAPTGVVNSPAAEVLLSGCPHMYDIQREMQLASLVRKTLGDGAVSDSLPTNLLRSIVAKLLGASRTAFVHYGAGAVGLH